MAGIVSDSFNLSSNKDDLKIKSISGIEEKLYNVLHEGPLTREQLVKKLGVPRTTVYDGLKKLIVRNEVKKYPVWATERTRGRPQVLFSLIDYKESKK
jgi:predicted ArsR family transcriptional regulator